MAKVICFGELLIDFTSLEPGKPLWQVERFAKNVGGAPANVAIGLHFHNVPALLWSKVGKDSFGQYLIAKIREFGLPGEGILQDEQYPTKLAFVGLNNAGERYFEFHNIESAERFIRLEDLNLAFLETARVFHFGGVALFGNRTYKTTLELLRLAKEKHCLVSFDPNIRIDLMANPAILLERFRWVLSFVDILKLSEDDWAQFFSNQSPPDLLNKGISLVIITEGAKGARLITRQHEVFTPSETVPVLDTTGAGDAFTAAFLAKLVNSLENQSLEELSEAQLQDWGTFANHWAGKIIQHPGAVSGYFTEKGEG
jgi:fructokinase